MPVRSPAAGVRPGALGGADEVAHGGRERVGTSDGAEVPRSIQTHGSRASNQPRFLDVSFELE
jgi:hypothetical protein